MRNIHLFLSLSLTLGILLTLLCGCGSKVTTDATTSATTEATTESTVDVEALLNDPNIPHVSNVDDIDLSGLDYETYYTPNANHVLFYTYPYTEGFRPGSYESLVIAIEKVVRAYGNYNFRVTLTIDANIDKDEKYKEISSKQFYSKEILNNYMKSFFESHYAEVMPMLEELPLFDVTPIGYTPMISFHINSSDMTMDILQKLLDNEHITSIIISQQAIAVDC